MRVLATDETSIEAAEAVVSDTPAAMALAARFGAFGVAGAVVAVLFGGAVAVVAGWYAAAMFAMVWAFLSRDPSVLGKQPDGTLSWPAVLLFLPYFAGIRFFAWAKRLVLPAARQMDEVAPGIFLGPLPRPKEVPEAVRVVVDLTAEFAEARAVVRGRIYHCLPTLNRLVPADGDLENLLEAIVPLEEPMLIHCGAGKGRSAEVAAALLLARGVVETVEEAEKLLQQGRPCVSLHEVQRQQVRRLDLRSRGLAATPGDSGSPRSSAVPSSP